MNINDQPVTVAEVILILRLFFDLGVAGFGICALVLMRKMLNELKRDIDDIKNRKHDQEIPWPPKTS